ncbi:MAG: NUDIX hydrolase [Candidatus Omnitrophica bacterium]|nr:NUDIX hydrolase [Candidatus Omnitrophota bacterium]
MKQKTFKVTQRKIIFSKGPIHLIDADVTMPSGLRLSRQIIEHPGAVVIIPQWAPDHFILVRQFRFAARTWLWEWPAGGIERGENLRDAARRELMEEAGYQPKKLTRLLQFYPSPGISSEVMYVFLAENLLPKKIPGDLDEEIECGVFSLKKIQEMIWRKKIVDAKTILGFYLLKERLEGKK